MSAYNRLNGTYCAENAYLLRTILEEEWQFDGIVVSDWGGVTDRVAGVEAGLHLQMPGVPSAAAVVAAVRAGLLSEGRLDNVARAVLRFLLRCDANRRPAAPANLDAHHELARRAAADAIVLLKNDGCLLPLDMSALESVAVIGTFVTSPRFQGSGSSQVVPTRLETIYDELARSAPPGCSVVHAAGYRQDASTDPELLAESRRVAASANAAVVVVGLPASYEEEGADRKHIGLPPSHNALVETVLQAQPNTVVVLVNGSAVAMPWARRAPAILESWLGGQAGGGGITDVLTGRVNPSGKLSETFPERLEDTPAFLSFPGDGMGSVYFAEGLFTGYRWYDARAIQPLFPFGHGLSYTSFSYANLEVDKQTLDEDQKLRVALRVTNTGDRDGKETVQLYVREQQPRLPRPERELKAFAKVTLAPSESTEVTFVLDRRAFAFYDPVERDWVTTSGAFDILVGASSRDIRLSCSIRLRSSGDDKRRPTRFSSIQEWLADPEGRELVQPYMDSFRQTVARLDAAGAISDFFLSMPIAKLVSFGIMDGRTLDMIVGAGGQQTV